MEAETQSLASTPALASDVPKREEAKQPDTTTLVIIAEDARGRVEWRQQVGPDVQLKDVASDWARTHGCKAAEVCLDDEAGAPLDLTTTPRALGWHARAVVQLTCSPSPATAASVAAKVFNGLGGFQESRTFADL
mmetsp:Transcript_12256/g.22688  ORF Transcript_12256/g.22688 Transcript_12256/m.22688 type:complete len:135 (-) Transcript_12256:334-738(-)